VSKFPDISAPIETWKKIPDHKDTEYYRMTFETMAENRDFIVENKDKSRYVYNNMYLEQLFISEPDYVLQYPNTDDLVIMFWDIETKTVGDGRFSKAPEQPILMIGYSIWTYDSSKGKGTKVKEVIIDEFKDNEIQDTKILSTFVDAIGHNDPDIIAGYNSERFDLPYLYERCKIRRVSMEQMGRNGREPWLTHDNQIYINGRIHYDMYKKVKKDQSLFGMKSKNLKEVARHYKAPLDKDLDIELKEEIQNTYKVWKNDHKRFRDYQSADVVRTEHVGLVYIRNDVTLAERLQVPLNNTMNTYASFIPKMFVARNMHRLGIISTETNFSKYNSLTGTYETFRKYNGKELKFQGALVGLYKHGLFPMTYKIDFTSMYPSSICTFNLGPDTTKLVDIKPYTGKYHFKKTEKFNWYRIPDKNFNVDMIVRVRNDVEGFLKKDIKMLWDERKKIKTAMKISKKLGANDDSYNALDSQQLAIKVILNSIFGMQGLRTSTYGDMITAAMITGLCRYTSSKVIQKYENKLIELDTDGMAIDAKVDEDDTNEWLNELVEDKFDITDNYMQMELDEVGEAYFCAMKNYITIEDGTTKLHGSAIKSSRFNKIQDRARDLAIEHVFNQKPIEEVVREAYDFSDCPVSDFESRVRLAKDTSSYDDKSGQVVFLAAQYSESTGNVCEEGTLLPYVVSKKHRKEEVFKSFYKGRKTTGDNYTYVGYIDNAEEIDHRYYTDQVDQMLAMFNICKVEQQDAFEAAGLKVGFIKDLETVDHDIEVTDNAVQD
jgi:DNA polymerase I